MIYANFETKELVIYRECDQTLYIYVLITLMLFHLFPETLDCGDELTRERGIGVGD